MSGDFYIVATPIGNLEDITFRAVETLKRVDLILCEDTRVTRHLLDHYQIGTPQMSFHQHSDARKVKHIKEMLDAGKNIALVTDAGTPGISDPGNQLVSVIARSEARATKQSSNFHAESEGIATLPSVARNDNIVPVPGPCAAIAALSISGFSTAKFIFLGFPPNKNKRQKFFQELAASDHTVVFYESSHRIKKCLQELLAVLEPTRRVVVCRELTKKFETIYRGTIAEVAGSMNDERGEFVVIVGAKQ